MKVDVENMKNGVHKKHTVCKEKINRCKEEGGGEGEREREKEAI